MSTADPRPGRPPKHDYGALFLEYQQTKFSQPKLSMTAFATAKGLDPFYTMKMFREARKELISDQLSEVLGKSLNKVEEAIEKVNTDDLEQSKFALATAKVAGDLVGTKETHTIQINNVQNSQTIFSIPPIFADVHQTELKTLMAADDD